MLAFAHTGKFFGQENTKVALDEAVIELLHCADKYEIADLKEEVVRFMKATLSCSNAIKFATAVELYRGDQATVNEFYSFCRK